VATPWQELNPAQQEAVQHRDGPCMVIAAAGSGKTAMLIGRIQYLIDECAVPPSKILACTFTRKAAEEMQRRLSELIGEAKAKLVTMNTLHSVAYRMVRNAYSKEWRLQPDTSWMVERVLEPANPYNPYGVGPMMKTSDAILGIAKAKADQRIPSDREPLGKVYRAYEAYRKAKKIYGLEDLVNDATLLCRSRATARDEWQKRWDYVLVDEFQDTNWAQWQLLLELTQRTNNLFVVGDDWQAIYGFRGARPELMTRHFQQQFPEARVLRLMTNYRSHDLIVELGNRIIALNRGHQLPKQVHAFREDSEAVVQVIEVRDEASEAAFIVEEIREGHRRQVPWEEMAILYRSNLQSRIYEEMLGQADIPYQVVGDQHFYRSPVVKGLLDYLRAMQPEAPAPVWGPLLNRPKRFIPKDVVVEVTERGWHAMMEHPTCRPFSNVLRALQHIPNPSSALSWLIQHVEGLVPEETQEEPWLESFVESAARFATIPEYLQYVDRVLERASTPKANGVRLSTVHRSKGLEFQTVFLVGMSEGLFPHHKSHSPEELREETRLCYVGITRAKENLYVLSASEYGGKPRTLSRYIQALQKTTSGIEERGGRP